MPLFGYVCRDCGSAFEVLVRNGETPHCVGCGSDQLLRQVSAAAPMRGAAAQSAPAGCGASQCCMAQGGCCPN